MSTHSLLSLNNLSITLHEKERTRMLVSGANLQIQKKEIVGLLGENGTGKTTLMLAIGGLLGERSPFELGGEILFQGRDLLKITPCQRKSMLGKDIGFIFQDPTMVLDPLQTVESHLLESIKSDQGFSKDQRNQRVQELLALVQLLPAEKYLNAYPFQLSGGQCQRLMIAIALANNPQLIIADEPTTSLDKNTCQEILSLLKDLQKKMGMSVLLISHDLELMKRFTDRRVILKNGFLCSYPEKSSDSNHPLRSTLKIQKPLIPLLKVLDVTVRFLQGRSTLFGVRPFQEVVSKVNFTLHKGEILGIFGDNGAGKTTLAKAILQLIPMTGSVVFREKDLAMLSSKALCQERKAMQMVFQNPLSSLNPKLTVRENIEDGLKLHEPLLSKKERLEKINEVLRLVRLDRSHLSSYPENLSGGEAQRVALARSFVLKPDFLILDEPTSSLDQESLEIFLNVLSGMNQKQGTSFLIISHDKKILHALCHRILEMKNGKLL